MPTLNQITIQYGSRRWAPARLSIEAFGGKDPIMLQLAVRTSGIVIGVVALLPVVFAYAMAWGEWGCGLHAFQITIASLAGSIGLSASLLCWRQTMPPGKRFSGMALLMPWVILGALALLVATLAPGCPFPSR